MQGINRAAPPDAAPGGAFCLRAGQIAGWGNLPEWCKFCVMRGIVYIFLVALAGPLAACQSPEVVEDRLVLAFGETMFGENNPTLDQEGWDSAGDRLARWRSPVDVSIVRGATTENLVRVTSELERFAELSGLEIRPLTIGRQSAELTIHFENQRHFIINGNQYASCYSRVMGTTGGDLARAEVHIARADDGKWKTDCLTHELLHAFGWRGHTHSIRSAISYMHGETELTRWDEYLMRTLYDPRLKPGIAKADAIPAVRVILREMLAKN